MTTQSVKVMFEFPGYWHMGSGGGKAAALDAVVVKSKNGLPIIPGKTVKGLLREAVTLATECNTGIAQTIVDQLFGTKPQTATRFETDAGMLTFTDATPGEQLEAWADGLSADTREVFYEQLASTSLDGEGQAEKSTLRKIEVAIPLTLSATVAADAGAENIAWQDALRKALPLLRAVGSHRHRGLGRVRVTMEGGAS